MFNKIVLGACVFICVAAVIFQFLPSQDQWYFDFDAIVAKLKEPLNQYISSNNVNKKDTTSTKSGNTLTNEVLARYTGDAGSDGLYLALLGKVYDVSKGSSHYGPGGGYHGFAGKDGTRAFVTGQFDADGLIPEVDGLSHQDYLGLEEWEKFYKKDYKYVGKVRGWFYDELGKPTEKIHAYRKALKSAHQWKQAQADEKKIYPPCNSEWSQDKGGRVWCSTKSGGIERDWAGVPRKLFKPASGQYRCACIRTTGPASDRPEAADHDDRGDLDNPNLKEYDNCDSVVESCPLPNE
ncbi:PREDICTED: neuferricin-like [Priapulus caudatus]|uniref:Neuferricin-like n=1 Tax=Priapulus caudatus TaxID=37621 RepID=A0ABM1EX57_PRICU|nr:PREDICTED: neuferricin-like [Priapulus caudatus]